MGLAYSHFNILASEKSGAWRPQKQKSNSTNLTTNVGNNVVNGVLTAPLVMTDWKTMRFPTRTQNRDRQNSNTKIATLLHHNATLVGTQISENRRSGAELSEVAKARIIAVSEAGVSKLKSPQIIA